MDNRILCNFTQWKTVRVSDWEDRLQVLNALKQSENTHIQSSNSYKSDGRHFLDGSTHENHRPISNTTMSGQI